MQLKQFYSIATKVSSKKSATTFGDKPDCSGLPSRVYPMDFAQGLHFVVFYVFSYKDFLYKSFRQSCDRLIASEITHGFFY